MALFKTQSAAIYGIDARLIDVEVDMYSGGSPRDYVTVGMPDVAVRESRERIRSAIINSNFPYPNKAFTINLAPANVRKEGAGFDLPEEKAFQIFRELMHRANGSRLAIYNDVLPAFKALQGQDIKLGVISNTGRQLPQLLASVGLTDYLMTVVSQGEVGIGKPNPGIFVAALERANLAPEEAIYVGDQYENDVVGARGAGLLPILVDRYDLFPDLTDCLRVRSLEEVGLHLTE